MDMEEQEPSNSKKMVSYSVIFWVLCIIIISLCGIIGFLVGKEKNTDYPQIGKVEQDFFNRVKCFVHSGCTVLISPQGIEDGTKAKYDVVVDCSPQNPSKILDQCGIPPINQKISSEE